MRSQKHATGIFLMGSPCVPLAPARRAFQLQTAAAVCHQKTRRSSSRVPPSAWGARLPPFFFSCKKKGGAKVKCALRKSVSPVATGDRGALPPRLPCKPLKRLDRNFTGLRPCGLRLQAVAFALWRVKPPQGAGRVRHRGTPEGVTPGAPRATAFNFLSERGKIKTWK